MLEKKILVAVVALFRIDLSLHLSIPANIDKENASTSYITADQISQI